MKFKLAFIATILFAAVTAQAQTVTRPIADWINAQSNEYLYFQPTNNNYIYVDYCGFWYRWMVKNGYVGDFGTTFSGEVNERPLKSGGTHVHVECYAVNALAWAGDYGNYANPWLGSRPSQILWYGATPYLGTSSILLDWDTASAPGTENLDLITLGNEPIAAQTWRMTVNESMYAPFNASSPWTAGTQGSASTTAVGSSKTQGKWATDGWATEFVHIGPIAP